MMNFTAMSKLIFLIYYNLLRIIVMLLLHYIIINFYYINLFILVSYLFLRYQKETKRFIHVD